MKKTLMIILSLLAALSLSAADSDSVVVSLSLDSVESSIEVGFSSSAVTDFATEAADVATATLTPDASTGKAALGNPESLYAYAKIVSNDSVDISLYSGKMNGYSDTNGTAELTDDGAKLGWTIAPKANTSTGGDGVVLASTNFTQTVASSAGITGNDVSSYQEAKTFSHTGATVAQVYCVGLDMTTDDYRSINSSTGAVYWKQNLIIYTSTQS